LTLLKKLKKSRIGIDSTQPAFEQLTKACQERNLPVASWKSDEQLAMEERGNRLKIFDVNLRKMPTLAEVTLQLCNVNANTNATVDAVDWIAAGIKAENDQ
jgi:hypothetical protein